MDVTDLDEQQDPHRVEGVMYATRTFSLMLLLSIGSGSSLAGETNLQEHFERLGLNRLHADGWKGQGITIAVLDSGFRHYRAYLGKALPKKVRTQSFRLDKDIEAKESAHGLLCAEVIHRMAPEAELLLANWEPDSPEHFLQAVRWAKSQGAKIINCSVVIPGWSDGKGNGSVHEQLKSLLGDGSHQSDLLLFAAAGNLAQRHWQGRFRDNGNRLHLWDSNRSGNRITPWGDVAISVEITHSPEVEYRLHVIDESDQGYVGKRFPLPVKDVYGHAIRFLPEKGHRYAIHVQRIKGQEKPFRLIVLGASLEHHSSEGSVVFPADGMHVIGVGAINQIDKRCDFSGCGSKDQKPDCVAPVPFPTEIRDGFSGTSAASPQASGFAALLWSMKPESKGKEIRQKLLQSCRDVGARGFDPDTGWGILCAPKP